MNKNKEIIVLDHKRSNAINIGMTKLPPPRSIKTAILKMDSTIMNREGIEVGVHDMKFSQQCYQRFKASGMLHCIIVHVVHDTSKDNSSFIFRVYQSKKN